MRINRYGQILIKYHNVWWITLHTWVFISTKLSKILYWMITNVEFHLQKNTRIKIMALRFQKKINLQMN